MLLSIGIYLGTVPGLPQWIRTEWTDGSLIRQIGLADRVTFQPPVYSEMVCPRCLHCLGATAALYPFPSVGKKSFACAKCGVTFLILFTWHAVQPLSVAAKFKSLEVIGDA